MRSIVIYNDSNESLLDKLNNLSNWTLSKGTIAGGHPYFLKNGVNEVHLCVIADNVIRTSNVLPQDHSLDHPNFQNDVLNTLSMELSNKNLEHSWDISDSDIKKL